MFARGFQLRNRPRPSTEALLHKLLAKGACPFLPPDNPAISLCGFAMAGPLADFMVRAHVAGQHLLSQEHVVGLLQLVLLHNHRPAYPQLLAILRQEGAEPLPPSLALQLLAIAARWGDEAAVRDALALVPQGVLTAPESAPACLLAHAALNDEPARPWPASGQPSRGQQSARIMRVLLDAKVALHINDVCRVVQEARPGVLRRLLRIGQPQASDDAASLLVWALSRAHCTCVPCMRPACLSAVTCHCRLLTPAAPPFSACHCPAARPLSAVCGAAGQHDPADPPARGAGMPRPPQPLTGSQHPTGPAGASASSPASQLCCWGWFEGTGASVTEAVHSKDAYFAGSLSAKLCHCCAPCSSVLLPIHMWRFWPAGLQTEHPYPSLPGALFEEFKLRMDVAEALGAAGYRPIEEVRGWALLSRSLLGGAHAYMPAAYCRGSNPVVDGRAGAGMLAPVFRPGLMYVANPWLLALLAQNNAHLPCWPPAVLWTRRGRPLDIQTLQG